MDRPQETPYAHYDQPAFEHMRIDHSISRIAIFFICFLTIGVFYFSLVSLPVAKMLPLQQIQQLTQLGSVLGGGSGTSSTATADSKPSGAALGGAQSPDASASSSSSASAAASPAGSSSAAASPSSSAAPSRSQPSPSPSSAAGENSYVVQAGDSLSAIARKYNTTVQAIANANKISDTGALKAGQRLVIPA